MALLLTATVHGMFRTRGEPNNSPTSVSSANDGTQAGPLVDQSTLWTARWLAQMPTSTEERQTAEDALHISDKEMDLAFATTVREPEQHPPAMSAKKRDSDSPAEIGKRRGSRSGESFHSSRPRTRKQAEAKKMR